MNIQEFVNDLLGHYKGQLHPYKGMKLDEFNELSDELKRIVEPPKAEDKISKKENMLKFVPLNGLLVVTHIGSDQGSNEIAEVILTSENYTTTNENRQVKVGDQILFPISNTARQIVKIEGEEYTLVPEKEILGILK